MLDPNKVYVITDAKDIHEMRFLGDCDWHDEVVLSLPFQNITGDCMIIPKNSTWNVNGVDIMEEIHKAIEKATGGNKNDIK